MLQPSPGPPRDEGDPFLVVPRCPQKRALFAVGTNISLNPGGPGGVEEDVLNQMSAVAQNGPTTAHFPQHPSVPTALASSDGGKKLPNGHNTREMCCLPVLESTCPKSDAGRVALSLKALGVPSLLFQLRVAPAAPWLVAVPLRACLRLLLRLSS